VVAPLATAMPWALQPRKLIMATSIPHLAISKTLQHPLSSSPNFNLHRDHPGDQFTPSGASKRGRPRRPASITTFAFDFGQGQASAEADAPCL
jgi:hypothetical protein